jgi:hypothetical protein
MSIETKDHKKTTSASGAQPAAVPDPDVDPAGYLRARGWTHVDGDPRTRLSRWLEPGAAATARDEILEVRKPQAAGGEKIERHVRHIPAGWPVGRDEAVLRQRQRDAAAV